MNAKSQKCVKIRVHEGRDPCEWELFAPDGTLIDGWHLMSVGRDHSGRHSLQITFGQFECVNAEGQPMEVHLSCPTAKLHEELAPLPSARTHKHRP
ncbi:hypothetical protein [Candidatus Nitronereus thalassa]|uniref:Uncharacterized protein n=1 Tax=Candidatus Nitronereus thalassa TaxID=3020898 RepID=A0ABU3K7P6_9BACT|nr:hypothetical protein [Candidatus Nitronereus thalassa]MDT7042384.1 hypothetical protein [Candidatus Nitronereus thalassa]